MEYEGKIDSSLYDTFLTGCVGTPDNIIEKPMLKWMSQKNWADVCKLSEFGGNLENIHKNFNNYLQDLNRIYNSQKPSEEPFPSELEAKLSLFEK